MVNTARATRLPASTSGRRPPSLRELEVLQAMIATRKTVAAAQMLGISQPAVSRALAALEAHVGRPLFAREGGRLVPTLQMPLRSTQRRNRSSRHWKG